MYNSVNVVLWVVIYNVRMLCSGESGVEEMMAEWRADACTDIEFQTACGLMDCLVLPDCPAKSIACCVALC